MACSKPIVISKGYSSAEAVDDNINGFLCNSNDQNHWVEKLNQLIKNPQLRNRMGQASMEKVKKEFQWEASIDTHLNIFEALIKI